MQDTDVSRGRMLSGMAALSRLMILSFCSSTLHSAHMSVICPPASCCPGRGVFSLHTPLSTPFVWRCSTQATGCPKTSASSACGNVDAQMCRHGSSIDLNVEPEHIMRSCMLVRCGVLCYISLSCMLTLQAKGSPARGQSRDEEQSTRYIPPLQSSKC